MTSSSRDQTGSTPPLSSDGNTEVKGQPSKPSANSDNTPTSTPTMKQPLKATKRAGTLDDRVREHAEIAGIALKQLEMKGLIRRYKVLSEDRTIVKTVILVFDSTYWTADLELRVLSDDQDNMQE
jgi:hypothetical protein